MKNLFNGKMKALTFSFDDGVKQDRRLIEILDKYGLLGDGDFDEKYRAMVFEAIYRYEKIDFEFKRICESFEENSIDFMPLKGSVLRKLYAEPWLRTSSDADILVKEKDLKRAEELLEKMSLYSD